MKKAWVDFETKSACDLKMHGAYNYAMHGSTEVLCMAWAIEDGEVQLWLPGMPIPDFTGMQIRAHNATFEHLIFDYVMDGPRYKREQFYCTAAQARANCLPGSLEDVGRAVSSSMRKDHRGVELVRKCCCPPFNQELLPELYEYCMQDVRAMRVISLGLRELTDEELRDYHLNERINDRGVLVDVALCRAAKTYSSDELEDVQEVFRNITGLKSIRSPKMRQWVWDNLGEQARKLMVIYKDGKPKLSIDKTVRANLLTFAEENPDEVTEDVAEVIACADDVWASSVAKFSRLEQLADEEDGRVRGAFVFNGGSATGRASSYGAQVHNFTRKCAKNPQAVRAAMVRGHKIVPEFGRRTSDVLKGMLRPALIPKAGHTLIVADWAGIEARMNAWLSNNPSAAPVLDTFRSGRDIYKREAAAIFHKPEDNIDSSQRQIGKVAILSCGYGGSVGAFAAMGRNYGVVLPEDEARRVVNGWRKANPWAVTYWNGLEDTYYRAMRNPNKAFHTARVSYMYDGNNLWYALPSGRVLCYPQARFEDDGITYLKAAWKPAADAKEWPRARLWHGLACENICQAASNDLLRNALFEADSIGLKVVLHVHDEIVLEVPEEAAGEAGRLLEDIMVTPPWWAEGVPLAVEWKAMEQYGK